jgi:formimidoylglutamate deiminase
LRQTLLPDLVVDAQGAIGGVGISVEEGRVVEVGPATDGERLQGKALAPGFINDHSHAFQRGLRGAVEWIEPSHPGDDFWTWREQMYALAGGLAPDSIREVSRRCYREMLSAGYTSVTEFHYVHHHPDGTQYENPNTLAKAVAQAAEDTGIRLLLLPVAYTRGGLPRFRDPSVRAFFQRVDALREWSEGRPLVEIGIAAHSVRAVPRGWLEEIGRYARRDDLPVHIHADEQPREIGRTARGGRLPRHQHHDSPRHARGHAGAGSPLPTRRLRVRLPYHGGEPGRRVPAGRGDPGA